MANRSRFTAAQVIQALNANKGMVYLAAKSLGCCHTTIYNYAKRYPSVQKAIDANRGAVVDFAELKLYDAILAGEHWAVAFALRTIGRDRGYVEKQALDVTSGGEALVLPQRFEIALERAYNDDTGQVSGNGGKDGLPAGPDGELPAG